MERKRERKRFRRLVIAELLRSAVGWLVEAYEEDLCEFTRTVAREEERGEGRGARRHGLPRMRVSSLCQLSSIPMEMAQEKRNTYASVT